MWAPVRRLADILTAMKTLTRFSMLLVVALGASGCRSTSPPTQQAQTNGGFVGDGNGQSADGGYRSQPGTNDKYSRAYDTESHRHRHHGRGNREGEGQGGAPNDNWTQYDRSEQGDGSPGRGGYARGRGEGGVRNGDHGAVGNGGQNSSRHHNSHAMTSAPGTFDFYLLNLSWSPEFCHGHPNAAECSQHRAFTLHGLWPQNNDGTYPEDCSEAPGPSNPSQYADIYPDAALLQHEWQTHGTCSGLGADAFFSLARRAEQQTRIPAELEHVTQGTSLSPDQIIALFTQINPGLPASSIAVSCGNNYLTAIEVCLDKNLQPESCQAVKSCGANQVRIPPPQ